MAWRCLPFAADLHSSLTAPSGTELLLSPSPQSSYNSNHLHTGIIFITDGGQQQGEGASLLCSPSPSSTPEVYSFPSSIPQPRETGADVMCSQEGLSARVLKCFPCSLVAVFGNTVVYLYKY